MEIRTTLKFGNGPRCPLVYRDAESWDGIDIEKVTQGYGYCFYNGKLVVVYHEKNARWTPPGGGREKGETPEQTTEREIREESNMRVIKQIPIGYQEITEPDRIIIQTRSFCVVEPIGDFISDPDGDIAKIKLIDPKDYKEYFDWLTVGDHIMMRALELLSKES